MGEAQVLQWRIDNLIQELRRAESALDDKPIDGKPINGQPIDDKLKKRVRARFNTLFKEQLQALAQVKADVGLGLPPPACWDSFHGIRQECDQLFREFLAFLQGAVVRSSGLDGRLCQIADAMLDNLSDRCGIPWGRFTILAEGEFFAEMAEIIRLRFGDVSVWNLPVAAHEFGHFISEELKVRAADGSWRYPFQEMLRRERAMAARNEHDLRELFADLFATYTIGPALAATCVLLRFDPVTAYVDGTTHPSAARRLYFMFKTLQKMDSEVVGLRKPYRDIRELLEQQWQKTVEGVKQPLELDADVTVELNAWHDELYGMLTSKLPDQVRYRGWPNAERLAGQLHPDVADPSLEDGDSLADVLNGAWLCRIQSQVEDAYQLRELGNRAVAQCLDIIARQ